MQCIGFARREHERRPRLIASARGWWPAWWEWTAVLDLAMRQEEAEREAFRRRFMAAWRGEPVEPVGGWFAENPWPRFDHRAAHRRAGP